MMNNEEIIKQLTDFDLNPKEAEIYLALIQKGILSPLQLSRLTTLNRTTIYRLLEHLKDLGLVEEIIDEFHRTKAKAITPDKLNLLIAKKEANILKLKGSLPLLQNNLNILLGNVPIETKVRYYRGKSGMEQMIWNNLKAKNNIVGYSTFGRREIVSEQFYQKFVEEFKNRKIVDRVITNPEEKTLEYLRKYVKPEIHQMNPWNIRYLKKEKVYISGDTTYYNNTFAVCYWRTGEIIGVEIENDEFVKSQKSIFEMLWNEAKPIQEII